MYTNKPLTAYHIKWLAMIAMTLDHIAWAFLDYDSVWSESFHFIGRLVAPLMCYFLAVGFYHSHDVDGYLKRLLLFAVISQFAFYAFDIGLYLAVFDFRLQEFIAQGNVMFSLFLALLALKIYKMVLPIWAKVLAILLICPVIEYADYGMAMLLWTFVFYYFYTPDKQRLTPMLIAYLLSTPVAYVLIYGFKQTVGLGFMHFGMILTALVIYLDNGKKGGAWGGRYLFYVFYPVHLLVLALIKEFTIV